MSHLVKETWKQQVIHCFWVMRALISHILHPKLSQNPKMQYIRAAERENVFSFSGRELRILLTWLNRQRSCFTNPVFAQELSKAAKLAAAVPILFQRRQQRGIAFDLSRQMRLVQALAARLGRVDQAACSQLEHAFVYHYAALLLDGLVEHLDQVSWDALLQSCYNAFGQSRRINSRRTRTLHAILLAARNTTPPEGIFVYQTRHSEDIREHFLHRLQECFPIHMATRVLYDPAHALAVLSYAVRASNAVLALASHTILRAIVGGKPVVQLWHGMGLLKTISMPGILFSQDYVVVSSPHLVRDYARIFRLPPERVLPLGCAQTDRYFDSQAVRIARECFFEKYPDLQRKTICVFAPTFRQGNPHWYRCGWEYARFDEKLERENVCIIYREHYVFSHIRRQYGRETTDLRNSPLRFVRSAPRASLFELICACDVFVTDYSSAMFYALLLDKPMFFYAPDLEEYKKTQGLEIDYAATVPGPIVRTPDPEALLRSLDDARAMVGSKQYAAFKQYHVGACDGRAGERVFAFLVALHSREKARLSIISDGMLR